MNNENHIAKLIPLYQGTSISALDFLYKNLVEIEKDLDCILNPSERKEEKEKQRKQANVLNINP